MKVYAHRGYSGRYPENTMLAFREAAKTGCDGIELDVQLTRDGQVVVIHDESLERLAGVKGYVRDFTLDELKRMNIAWHWRNVWHRKNTGYCKDAGNRENAGHVKNAEHQEGAGQRDDTGRRESEGEDACDNQEIPTFEEYCAWVQGLDLITNVEIKTGVYYYEELEEKTLELVRRYGLERHVMFSSFNPSSLALLRRLAPDIPCGVLVGHEGLGNAGYYCEKHGFACYHPGHEGLTEEEVKGCRERGIAVNVYTVNDMGTLERLYDWNCDGVISDYPGVCRAWLDGKKQGWKR